MNCTESDIQRTCTEFLQLDGWRALRTDPCSDKSRAKGFGEKGMADYLYIRYATGPRFKGTGGPAFYGPWADGHEILWVEYKGPRGVPTRAQFAWHDCERERGALTVLMGIDCDRSIEGFMDWYRNSGLQRRNA